MKKVRNKTTSSKNHIISYRIFFVFLSTLLSVILGFRIVSAAADVGYKDFSYLGATPDTGAFAPTGQKPQSKLWYNDGIWWGVLFNKTTIQFEIYRFNWATQSWSSTGVTVDIRPKSSADALWDGSKLYIVSAVPPESAGADNSISLRRYSYNATTKTYSQDGGFPVTIAVSAIETVVMDKDATGKLWVTYTDDNGLGGRKVLVTHTTTDDYTWLAPFQLPLTGAGNLNIDDISTIVSYSNKIGVMWSNQTDNTLYFAFHNNTDPDTTWTLNPAVQGPKYADDHMNIKSLLADPSGQVFAVVKTSLSDNNPPIPSDPLILLLKLDNQGAWTRRTFGTVADNHTRPIVLIDQENRELYVFATVQYSGQFSGAVYYKKISLDNNSMQFPSGLGTPFMEFAAFSHINNSTSTKQALNSATDLLVVASDDNAHSYFHNVLDLSSSNAGPLLSDDFESGTLSAWTETKATGGASVTVQSSIVKNGSFAARMTESTKAAQRAYIRSGLAVPQIELTTSGYFMITQEGLSGGNVPIFKLLNPSGGQILSLYRKNLDSNRVYVTDLSTTSLTNALLPLNTWAKFELYVNSTGAGTSTIRVYLNDVQVLSTTTANLGTAGVGSVLLGNDVGGQQFNLVADDIVIRRGSTIPPAATATPTYTATSAFSPTPTFTPIVSTLFNDGFESGDFTAWNLAIAGGDGTIAVQNTTVKNGIFASQLAATANAGSDSFARKIMSSPEVDLTSTGYFMVTQEGVSGANIPIFRLFDLSGNRLISLYRQNLDLNKVYFTDLSGAKTIVSGTMPLNTWTKFDLHVITSGAGTSTLDIYLNGVLAYHSTTANLGSAGVSVVQIGNDTSAQTFALFADDVSVSRGFSVIVATATPTSLPATATLTRTPTSTLTSTPTATLTRTPTASTATAIPPTATSTFTPTATATNTAVPPTATFTFTPTASATNTTVPPTATFTFTPTASATNTAVPPTATFTFTPTASATATFTSTATSVAPTETATSLPATFTPTETLIPPTETATDIVPTENFTPTVTPLFTDTPTSTALPPTETFTPEAATFTPTFTALPTDTLVPPTATYTAVPPTNTFTPVPATATPTFTASPTNTATSTNTAVPPTSTPSAGNLFTDGFESGNFSAWTSVTTVGDGSASVQNTVVNSGNYAALLSETANTGSAAYIRKRLSASETNLTVIGYFRITQEGVSGGNVPLIRMFDSIGTRLVTVYRQNLDSNRIYAYDGITRYLATRTMPLNTWVKIEMHVITTGSGTSTIQVYINDVLAVNTSAASLGSTGVLTIQLGNDTAKQIFTLYTDDVSIHN